MERVLVLRTCNSKMRSYWGFEWPESGDVSAPDWDPTPRCGNGLHGLLWGEGNYTLMSWLSSAKWVVCSVDPAKIVDLGGKVKFPECKVVHVGDRKSATSYVYNNGGRGYKINGLRLSEGNGVTVNAGSYSVIKAGDNSKIMSGHYSNVVAGADSSVGVDNHSKVTSGDRSRISCQSGCRVRVGDHSTVLSGDDSWITGGEFSVIESRWTSRIKGGRYSKLKGGSETAMSGGPGSVISSVKPVTGRIISVTIGEGGFRPNVFYRHRAGNWVEV